MYTMSVDFVGDCTSLVNAANNSMAAIRRADGMSATMGISAPGAPSVIQQLTSVGDLQKSISGVSTVDVKVGAGVGALQGELSASRGQVKGLGDDLKALGGVGIGTSIGVNRLTTDLSGASSSALGLAGQLSRVQQIAAQADVRGVTRGVGDVSSATSGLGQSAALADRALTPMGSRLASVDSAAGDMAAPMRQVALAMAGGGEGVSIAESAAAGSSRVQALGADMAAARKQFSGMSDDAIATSRALNSNGLVSGFDVFEGHSNGLGIAGTPDGPPPRVGGGGGGGGGGGSGAFGGAFGESARSIAPGGMNVGALSTLAFPGAMLAAVGVVEPLAAAAAGVMAVNQVVKNTPGLMLEANRAMNSFNDGVRSASVGALSQGVPAFQQLGDALKPLGVEVGRVGTAQMGTVLGGASELARGATTALQSLEPAFGPSIRGAVALGDAILAGIASPGVAQGIANVGTMLQDPNVEKGVAAATGGILQMATQTASLLGPVMGAVGPALGGAGPTGASATGDQWYNEPTGKLIGDLSGPSGVFRYDQSRDDASSPFSGVSLNQNNWVGRTLAAVGSIVDPTAGDTRGRVNAIFQPNNPPPNGIGLDQPSSSGRSPLTPPGQSQYGWQQNTDGSYSELGRPNTNLAPQTGSPVFKPEQALPSAGSSVLSLNASQAERLNTAMQPLPPTISQTASALSVANQQAAVAAPPLQTFAQSANVTANQIQQLGQSSVSTFSLLGDTSTSATQQLAGASSAITSGSQQLGSSVPQSMAQGITANTGAACDATANLGANAVNCAKSALDAHSPSRKFVDLGMGTGEGFALGVNDSAGLAASSVARSMNGAIAAASGVLNSNSPSKAFQNLAANAFGQNLPGNQFQNQAVSQMNSVYGQQTQASLAQSQIQARNEEERAKQQAAQARAQASAAQASRGGLSNTQLQQLPPDVQAALRAGVPLNDAQKQSLGYDSWRQQRGDALDKFHWSDHTKTDVLNREEARKGRADQRHLEGRDPDSLRDNAKARLHSPWGHEQANKMREEGNLAGHSWGNGTADGIRNSSGKIGSSAADAANHGTDELKKKAGVSSPSTVWAQVGGFMTDGLAQGISNGFGSISQSIAPIASNTGLMVGYVFGQNMINGTLSVIKSADYQTAAVTGIGSKLAETALGQLGMLGPAGSGASIPKNAAITLTESGAASGTTPIVNATINVQVGDQPVRDVAHQVVDAELKGLTTAITMQG